MVLAKRASRTIWPRSVVSGADYALWLCKGAVRSARRSFGRPHAPQDFSFVSGSHQAASDGQDGVSLYGVSLYGRIGSVLPRRIVGKGFRNLTSSPALLSRGFSMVDRLHFGFLLLRIQR